MKKQIQIIKKGRECWEVHQVEHWSVAELSYEIQGRVFLENGLYYAERVRWLEDGYEYVRIGRGFLLPKAAFRALAEEQRKDGMKE